MVIPANPPPAELCKIGKGNSPPARKLASLPDSVNTFGSAKIWSRFFACNALITAPRWILGLNRKIFKTSVIVCSVVNCSLVTGCGPLTGKVSVIFGLDIPPNWPVVMLPMVFPAPVESIFRPSWLRAVRSTSANRTCRRICPAGGTGICIKLVTLGVALLTTSRILSATVADDTRPDNMTTSLDVSTCTGSEGKTSWIFWLNPKTSMSTETSNAWLWSDSSHNSSETPPGVFPFTRTWVGLTTMASAILGSARDTLLIRVGEEITIERPTNKCRVFGASDSSGRTPWVKGEVGDTPCDGGTGACEDAGCCPAIDVLPINRVTKAASTKH